MRILAELRARAGEKERTPRELQHRVRNNLQTVMSLVGRAVRRARHPEAVGALRTVGDGIEVLRLIHNKTYRTDGGDRTCLGTYLAEPAASLLAFHGAEVAATIRLITDIKRLDVSTDIPIPFGLITSEFISNSPRYAFDDDYSAIELRLERAGSNMVRVALQDDGKVLPAERSGGTAIRLINGLARQVGATSQWS